MVFSKVELNHTYHREQWLSSGRGIASRNRMHSEGQRHIMFHGHLYRTWRGELDNFLMSYMTMGPWHWSEITPPSYFLPLSSLQTSSKLSLPTLASLPFHTLLAPFSLRKFLFHGQQKFTFSPSIPLICLAHSSLPASQLVYSSSNLPHYSMLVSFQKYWSRHSEKSPCSSHDLQKLLTPKNIIWKDIVWQT